MLTKDALKTICEKLGSRLEAELILMAVLGLTDRSQLTLKETEPLTVGDWERALELCVRRENGEPMAYILGEKEFFGRKFLVSAAVLIPRPETEVMVEWAVELIQQKLAGGETWQVVDVGTGSGCIAISVALLTGQQVLGVDVSTEALAVARANATRLKAEVDFLQSDLLAQVEKYDLVLANLPYVDRGWPWLTRELDFEPEQALYAEEDGLFLIKKLLKEMAEKVMKQRENAVLSAESSSEKIVLLESDESQHLAIKQYAEELGFTYIGTRELIIGFKIG